MNPRHVDSLPAAAQPSRRPPLALVAVLLVEALLLLRALPSDPLIARRLDPPRVLPAGLGLSLLGADWVRNDPAVGTSMPIPSVPAGCRGDSRARTHAKGHTLVFVGGCSTCSESILDEWVRAARTHPSIEVIVVSRDTPANVARFSARWRWRLPIVCDHDLRLARAYNAVWVPRAYGVGPGGRLVFREGARPQRPAIVLDEVEDLLGGR